MKPYRIEKVEGGGFFLSRGDQAISLTCADAEKVMNYIAEKLVEINWAFSPQELEIESESDLNLEESAGFRSASM